MDPKSQGNNREKKNLKFSKLWASKLMYFQNQSKKKMVLLKEKKKIQNNTERF